MIKIFKKIIQILRKHKIHKIVKYIIENKEAVDAYLDTLIDKANNPVEDGEVHMTLDYVPSWLTDAKTLLEKVNRCVEQIEKQTGLYLHNISFSEGSPSSISIISKRKEAYTASTLSEDFNSNKIVNSNVVGKAFYKNGVYKGSCLFLLSALFTNNTLVLSLFVSETNYVVETSTVVIDTDEVIPL